jgi:ATP-binding cassette, subfamily B, multidrug efflux pump
VVGIGTHSELIESCPVYLEFAYSQTVVAGEVA